MSQRVLMGASFVAGVVLQGCAFGGGSYEMIDEKEVSSCTIRDEVLSAEAYEGRLFRVSSSCSADREWSVVYEITDVTFHEQTFESISSSGESSLDTKWVARQTIAAREEHSDLPSGFDAVVGRHFDPSLDDWDTLESPCNGPGEEWDEGSQSFLTFQTKAVVITYPAGSSERELHSFDDLEVFGDKTLGSQTVAEQYAAPDEPCRFTFEPFVAPQ